MSSVSAKFKTLTKYQKIVVIIAGLFLLSGILNLVNYYRKPGKFQVESAEKSCFGTENCISGVRANFNSTGKTILGEEYLGNGKFGISFMDFQHAGNVYNATVWTDCNCTVLDVRISKAR